MINNLIKYLENKKILILGFGMEGYSTYRLIRRYLPDQEVYLSDANIIACSSHEDVLNDSNAIILPTDRYLKDLEKYDVIMKTPCLSFKDIDTSNFIDKIKILNFKILEEI